MMKEINYTDMFSDIASYLVEERRTQEASTSYNHVNIFVLGPDDGVTREQSKMLDNYRMMIDTEGLNLFNFVFNTHFMSGYTETDKVISDYITKIKFADVIILFDGYSYMGYNKELIEKLSSGTSPVITNQLVVQVNTDGAYTLKTFNKTTFVYNEGRTMMCNGRSISINNIVKHFKAETAEKSKEYEYVVLGFPRDTETEELSIYYRKLYSPFSEWVRPAKMFMEKVDKDKYPNIKQTYRFEKMEV